MRKTNALLPMLALLAAACGGGEGLSTADVRPIDIVIPDTGADVRPDGFSRDVNADALPPDPGAPDVAPDLPPDPGPPDLPADPGPVDDGPADTAPDVPADDGVPDGGCRGEGGPCNDGDDCTVNDTCTGGVCVGTPFPCPDDDGLPCTRGACVRGSCTVEVTPGYCRIDGACWPDGQVDPSNGCRACTASLSMTAWSPREGACDDGDACTGPDACDAGACKAGPWTCPETPCRYHTDCYPDRWCGKWLARNATFCSAPCRGNGDCGADEVCSPVPGSASQGYCQPAIGAGADGAPCTQGTECASGLCTEKRCTAGCEAQAGCAPGSTCAPVGGYLTRLSGACVADAGDPFLPLGSACSSDGTTYDSSLCRSGHCDLGPDNPPWTCAPLCTTDAQCGPSQECNMVLRTEAAVAGTVPYDPAFTTATYDAVMACYTRAWTGFKGVGVPCTQPSECTTNKCMALVPGSATMWCTTFCTTDADCPATMACKSDAVTLVSAWLQSGLGQAAQPNGHALIRICKLK